MLTSLNLGRLGRFANQMFTIAGVIGIAEKSGNSFGFPQWINWDAKERFGTTEDIEVYKYFVNPLPSIPEGTQFNEIDYFWGYKDLYYPEGNFSFNSHFQAPKYFEHCLDKIRYYFTMKGEEIRNELAIHMRFGDYDDNYHPRPNPEYYSRAIAEISKKGFFGSVRIFSDDYNLASDLMNKIAPDKGGWYFNKEDYISEFIAMKCCKHFICGNSSYSLMAAILADQPEKIIIAPRNWFGPAWGPNYIELAKDIYPHNCIVI